MKFNFLKKNLSGQSLTGSYACVVEDDGNTSCLDDGNTPSLDDGDISGLDDGDTPGLDDVHLVILVNPTQ